MGLQAHAACLGHRSFVAMAQARPLSYSVFMDTTLTIRTDEGLRKALEERARAQGKSLSEVARDILQAALQERPLGL